VSLASCIGTQLVLPYQREAKERSEKLLPGTHRHSLKNGKHQYQALYTREEQ